MVPIIQAQPAVPLGQKPLAPKGTEQASPKATGQDPPPGPLTGLYTAPSEKAMQSPFLLPKSLLPQDALPQPQLRLLSLSIRLVNSICSPY